MEPLKPFVLGTISPNEGYILSKLARMKSKPVGGYERWIKELRPRLATIGRKLVGLDPIEEYPQFEDDQIAVEILTRTGMIEKLKQLQRTRSKVNGAG